MRSGELSSREKPVIIGVIPQFPPHSKQNIYAKVRMPPVGILSVLAQLKRDFGIKVYAIDENNYSGPVDSNGLPDHMALQKSHPVKIAMFYGGMSNAISRMYYAAKQYQALGIPTIAGGSHVDALPKEALQSGIDVIVHGEGEETAKELFQAIISDGQAVKGYKKRLEQIVGISFLNEHDNYVFTGKREPLRNLDELADPDLGIVRFMGKDWSSIPISRGRGCNFKCEFCVVNKQYGAFKAVSVDKAFNQIKHYAEQGYKHFFVVDDNFAQNIPETIELCRMIGDYKTKSSKKLGLMVQVRTEVAENDELIEAMRYAGVSSLAIGYESPINEELRAMRKGVTVEKLVQRSRKLSRSFHLHGMFIFGYPTFKDSEFKSSLTLKEKSKVYANFFQKARIDTVQIFNAVPLPGSELRTKLEAEDRIPPLSDIGWDKYDGLFLCYKPEEGIDAFELQNLPLALMKQRYLGSFLKRNLNYANWMNWAYDLSIGFPINFSIYYAKSFVHNLKQKEKEQWQKLVKTKEKLLPERNVFYESLVNAWQGTKKRIKNLAIRTYGADIVRKWVKLYKENDYSSALKKLSSKERKARKDTAQSS
jgi:radical SAM superfamily enzyme YgiQ (UPF0313 family)